MATTKFQLMTEPLAYAIPVSNDIDAYYGDTASQQFTPPTDARLVLFSGTGDFYVKIAANPTAAVPAADVSDGTASELNPAVRWFNKNSDKIAVIAAADVVVTMSYYS